MEWKRSSVYFIGCLIMCAALLLTACGKEDGAGEDAPLATGTPVRNTHKQEWVYVPERIEIPDRRADYDAIQLAGDTVCYLSMNGEAQGEPLNICQYSLAGRELKAIPIDWQDDGSIREISCYAFDENRTTWLIANVYSAGFGSFRRFLYQFDPEGNNLFFRDVSEQLGSGTSVEGMAVDGQGRIYVFNPEEGILLYDREGSYVGAISYGSSENVHIKGAVEGNDGKFYVCIGKGEDAGRCALAEVDFEGQQLTASIQDFPAVNKICRDSTGQYDLLLCDDSAAYGYHLAEQKAEKLFLWEDSDINGYFVQYLNIMEDGRYFCAVEDWTYDDRSIVLLTRTSAEEAPQRIHLVLAAVGDGSARFNSLWGDGRDLAGKAARFNRNNYQYHVTVKNYASLTDLYTAILTKEDIDLIDLSGINVKSLARQGVFEDLAPYLEQSGSFGPSDFLEGILDVYSFGGALVGIPENFTLRTVVGNRPQIGNESRLTLDGLSAAAGRNPGACPLDGVTREEMMQYFMMFNEEDFIDWETGECRFDSEQFRELLELCSRLPGSDADHDQGGYGHGLEKVPLSEKVRNGQVLFAIADIHSLKSFRSYVKVFGEDTECIGFPAADGRGGTVLFPGDAFGIAAVSKNKEGAWVFIENILGQMDPEGMEVSDIGYEYTIPDRFPVRKEIMDAIIEYQIEDDRWQIEKGRLPSVAYENGWKLTDQTVTADEINVVLDLIKTAKPFIAAENDRMIQIINEEAEDYYSGQKNIEDVTGMIQNRVQVYVDENR